jgi:hypothetical protein
MLKVAPFVILVVGSLISLSSGAFADRWVATGWVTCANCNPPDNRRQGYQIDRAQNGAGMKSKSDCLRNIRSLEAQIRADFLARKPNAKLRFERRCDYK